MQGSISKSAAHLGPLNKTALYKVALSFVYCHSIAISGRCDLVEQIQVGSVKHVPPGNKKSTMRYIDEIHWTETVTLIKHFKIFWYSTIHFEIKLFNQMSKHVLNCPNGKRYTITIAGI